MTRRRLSGGGFRSILCPVDFSMNSRAALRSAAAIAGRSRGRLTVLFVNDPLLASAAAAAAYDERALAEQGDRELHRFVTTSLGTMRQKAPPRVITAVGKPAAEIVAAAREHRCDLIVMGTRGLGGVAKFFLGSTTQGVLQRTDAPVLAIPPVGGKRTHGRHSRARRP